MQAPAPAAVARTELGLPEGFVFLFVFDYASVFERKNPVGLVRAFKQAFAPGEGPVLAIKSINGGVHLTKREWLHYEAEGRPDIVLLEEYLPAGHKDALLAACDCYVSLHRAEGFGLTMAEAMALGKPTIATGYSGNLEFMTPENSYLVGWQRGDGAGRLPTLPRGGDVGRARPGRGGRPAAPGVREPRGGPPGGRTGPCRPGPPPRPGGPGPAPPAIAGADPGGADAGEGVSGVGREIAPSARRRHGLGRPVPAGVAASRLPRGRGGGGPAETGPRSR